MKPPITMPLIFRVFEPVARLGAEMGQGFQFLQRVQTGQLEIGFIGAEHLVREFAPELNRMLHLSFRQAGKER